MLPRSLEISDLFSVFMNQKSKSIANSVAGRISPILFHIAKNLKERCQYNVTKVTLCLGTK